MVSRQQVVTAARAKLGAAFRHQGRGPEAYDCVGLVIKVAHELGLSEFDSKAYTRAPDPVEMREALESNLDYVPFRTVQPGDVLWFRAPEPQHLAVVTQLEPMLMVHAHSRAGRVVESRIDRFWRGRIVACFRYRGLDG
jgi:cell wall-associated NlpC family hydrolase